jgi:hypothetical protein
LLEKIGNEGKKKLGIMDGCERSKNMMGGAELREQESVGLDTLVEGKVRLNWQIL